MTILIVIVSIALLVLADQCSKIIATAALADGTTIPLIGDFLQLSYTRNTGAAWGMLSGSRIILIVGPILILTAGIALLCSKKIRHSTGIFSAILVMAGGLGNLIDRIFQPDGAVVDYIYFNFKPLFDFPIFNFADICVTFGYIFLLIYIFFYLEHDFPQKKEKEKRAVDRGNGLTVEETGTANGGEVIDQTHADH